MAINCLSNSGLGGIPAKNRNDDDDDDDDDTFFIAYSILLRPSVDVAVNTTFSATNKGATLLYKVKYKK
jgi:hypothetical protein